MEHRECSRIVAIGASNLTRGLHAVVAAARQRWGPEVEILAASGHGRSYGAPSRFLVRSLPGILQCGLWAELDRLPRAATRALVADVGNDILYGESAGRILGWIDECVARLRQHGADIVLAGLPLFTIGRLSPAKFLVFRTLFVPSCRLSLAEVRASAERVAEGLEAIADRRSIRLFPLRPEWYGVDPIHIRPAMWRTAWRDMLFCDLEACDAPQASRWEGVRLYLLPPERRGLLGVERLTPQRGRRLRRGGRIRLY